MLLCSKQYVAYRKHAEIPQLSMSILLTIAAMTEKRKLFLFDNLMKKKTKKLVTCEIGRGLDLE